MEPQIPDKLYFKIGEVAELVGVKAHVLRYWETEIGSLRPAKNRHQQRLYRRRDIELLLHLKELLYTQGYTIAGARKMLRRKSADAAPAVASPPPPVPEQTAAPSLDDGQLVLPLGRGIDRRLLDELRRDLVALRNSLSSAP